MTDTDLFDLDQLDQMINDIGSRKSHPSKKSKSPVPAYRDDFDDLLDLAPKEKKSTLPSGQKCYPCPYLTPSGECGITKYGKVRQCDKLRCVQCDFGVVWFDNSKWSSEIDYLFLRNNHPDKTKLRAMIQPQPNRNQGI